MAHWIASAEARFRVSNIPGNLWLSIASAKLESTANIWFASWAASTNMHSWDLFSAAIRARFGSADSAIFSLQELMAVKQNGSITEYIEIFDRTLHRSPQPQETIDTVFKNLFIANPKQYITKMLYLPNILTLNDAYQAAENADAQANLGLNLSRRETAAEGRTPTSSQSRSAARASAYQARSTPQKTTTRTPPIKRARKDVQANQIKEETDKYLSGKARGM